MEQQFDDIWFGVTAVGAAKSGIYTTVKAGFLLGHYSACFPTSLEKPTVDWQGNAILYQTLSNGYHCEWKNGVGTVYAPTNQAVFTR